MNRRILQRMIWKDARTLRTLAIATPALIVGFFVLLELFAGVSHVGTERMGLAYAIWMLLPMLIACGAPAVLIGGEEESGSLAWLQTLPAGWKTITASKLLVTSVCLLLAWAVATICFLAYWSALSDDWIDRIRQSSGLPEPFWIHCAGAVALSIAVMLSSFTTAYWFRSPITALVTLVPLVVASDSGTSRQRWGKFQRLDGCGRDLGPGCGPRDCRLCRAGRGDAPTEGVDSVGAR